MPSPTKPPRPAYGQIWEWMGSVLFLIAPTDKTPTEGEWQVIRISGFVADLDPYGMFGLYSDREPIRGYTFIDGDTAK